MAGTTSRVPPDKKLYNKKTPPETGWCFFMLSHTFQWAGHLSNFDFNFNAAWQLKLHQGIYSFRVRAVNV
jgi:hypothetical protein